MLLVDDARRGEDGSDHDEEGLDEEGGDQDRTAEAGLWGEETVVGAEEECAEDEGADGCEGFGPAVLGAVGRLAGYAEADEDCVA